MYKYYCVLLRYFLTTFGHWLLQPILKLKINIP